MSQSLLFNLHKNNLLKKYQIKREAKFGQRLLIRDASFQVSRDSNEGVGSYGRGDMSGKIIIL